MGALLYILNAVIMFVVIAFLLRLLMQLVRADFRNPFGQAVLKFTNPVVLPLRKVLPPAKRFDVASLVALLLVQFACTALVGLMMGRGFRVEQILLSGLLSLAVTVLQFYTFAVFVYALLSWFAGSGYNPIAQVLTRICEPLLEPIRRILPPIGGLDLSALVLIVLLQALLRLLPGY